MSTLPARQLGQSGLHVSMVGLGCMGMSGMYGPTDDNESVRAIHAAIERGVTLLDTGDFYGMGHNEMLIARALRELPPSQRENMVLSVKFGAMRTPSGAWSFFDGRPAAVKNFLAYSLKRLGVSQIDIYRPARLDDNIPVEDTIGAISDMIRQGFVKSAALSEVSVETARRAQTVTPIADVQLEYGLATRGIEARLLPGLRALGIGVTAYGVFSRGLLTGADAVEKTDFRRFLPRFGGSAGESNRRLVAALDEVAAEHGVSTAQMLVAWILTRGDDIVPILGSRTVMQVEDALDGAGLQLSPEQLARLEQVLPSEQIQGTRYDKVAMTHLDSER